MNVHVKSLMTVEEFFAWGDARAIARGGLGEGKWELHDGVPTMQDMEPWAHVRAKFKIAKALEAVIVAAGLDYDVGIDGIGVRIDANRYLGPELVVFPAGVIKDEDRMAPSPIIVVEVLSPTSVKTDLTKKVVWYARVPTILHYLVLDPPAREILHWTRRGDLLIPPDAPSVETVRLDPPGVEIAVTDCF